MFRHIVSYLGMAHISKPKYVLHSVPKTIKEKKGISITKWNKEKFRRKKESA